MHKPQTNRTIQFERRGANAPRQSMKPKAWNHQDELKAARGKMIVLTHRDGQSNSGVLLEADQFTLKVEIQVAPGDKSPLTFFKHDLAGYFVKS